MEYHLAMRKEILPFVTTWMDLKSIILNEISYTEKDKYKMVSLKMWNIKKKLKIQRKNKKKVKKKKKKGSSRRGAMVNESD